jgi:type IV pilus assembly protein PilA
MTLIELMAVLTIVGALGAVAMPAYSDYVARAQVTEATGLLSSAKAPLAEYFLNTGRWPDAPGEVMASTSGKYTASITYFGTPDPTKPGIATLMATFNSFGISTDLRNTTFVLATVDGGETWRCASGGTKPISDRYLPGACR